MAASELRRWCSILIVSWSRAIPHHERQTDLRTNSNPPVAARLQIHEQGAEMTQRIPVRAVSSEIAAQLRGMNDLNDEYLSRTRRIYLPLLKALDRSGISVEKDI